MNDIAKTNTQTRLNKAIESEGLKINEAAACLGIQANYISMIRNEKHWPNCSAVAWDATLNWVNSGQSLKEYSEKHGKVLPEKPHIELPPKVVTVRTVKEEPLIRVKPEVLEKRQKELAERKKENIRPSKGQMVDMLLEEKESLKAKIDAIDILLKHYIS